MAKQDVAVELFYSGAWQTAPTYTRDPITITRGRGDETSEPTPSTATLTLDNRSGDYNPRNASSPLYGLVGRNTLIRVSVGGQVRFFGEVSSWKPGRTVDFDEATGRGDAWTEVEAAGILRRLDQGADVLASAMGRAMRDTTPTAWWPLEVGDGRATTSSPSAVDGQVALQATPATAGTHRLSGVVGGATTGPPGCGGAIDLSGGGQLTAPVEAGASATTWRFDISVLFTEPVDSLASGQIYRINHGGGLLGLYAGVTAGAELSLEGSDGVDFDSHSASVILDDGAWHHVQSTFTRSGASTTFAIVVDGVSVLTGSLVNVALSNPYRVTISPTGDVDAASNAAFWVGTLPASGTGYEAFTGHLGETAADRFGRLCSEQSVSAITFGVSADSQAMGAQRVDTFAGLLAEIERTDGGLLWEPRNSLALVLTIGSELYNQTSSLTVNYAADEVATPFDPVVDDQGTRNDVTAQSSTTGKSARAVLESGPMSVLAPPSGVGRYTTQVVVNPESDDDLVNHAGWHLHKGTVDEVRFPRLSVDLVASPGLVAAATAVDIGYRITVANLPTDVGDDEASLIVLGYTETIGSHRRSITFNTTPASTYTVATADGEPRVAADGSTLAAGLSATGISTLNSNPYFESTVTPWTAVAGGTVARSTAQAHEGVASLLFTPNGVTATVETRSENAPGVVAGQTYQASAWVRCAVARSVNANIVWRDAAGVFLSSAGAVSVSVAATTWALVTVSGTAPALAAQGQISVSMGSTPPASHLLHIDEALLRATVTMQLASTPANGVWTTDPADFPLDMRVGGEQVTASAISGTTSPQTVTLSARGVNGVQRAWAAGTEVDVWTPAIAPL